MPKCIDCQKPLSEIELTKRSGNRCPNCYTIANRKTRESTKEKTQQIKEEGGTEICEFCGEIKDKSEFAYLINVKKCKGCDNKDQKKYNATQINRVIKYNRTHHETKACSYCKHENLPRTWFMPWDSWKTEENPGICKPCRGIPIDEEPKSRAKGGIHAQNFEKKKGRFVFIDEGLDPTKI